jgi:hypothetical protein
METDAAFLLRVLSDGRPHSLNEILQASFAERGCGLTVHSRAASLRAQGHNIVNKHIRGAQRGASSVYWLVKPEPVYECVVDESAGQAEQLSLNDRAAAHIYRDMANTPYA